MSQEQSGSEIVSLNDLSKIIGLLSSKNARSILGTGIGLAGCTEVDCGCNSVRCGCRGSDTAIMEAALNLEEFQKLRESKITELQNQLKKLQSG